MAWLKTSAESNSLKFLFPDIPSENVFNYINDLHWSSGNADRSIIEFNKEDDGAIAVLADGALITTLERGEKMYDEVLSWFDPNVRVNLPTVDLPVEKTEIRRYEGLKSEAGLSTQIRNLKKRLKDMDTAKCEPNEVRGVVDALEALEKRYEAEKERKAKKQEEKEKEASEMTTVEAGADRNETVIQMFIDDSFPKDKRPVWGTANLKISKMGPGWALVNYATPIMYRSSTGELFFNTTRYSVTTSRIQNMIRSYSAGASEVDESGIRSAISEDSSSSQTSESSILSAQAFYEGLNPGEQTEAHELELWLDNTYELYQQKESIILNVARKIKRGVYDPSLAPKLWRYLVDAGAQDYAKKIADPSFRFSTKVRQAVAEEYAKNEYEMIMNGEYDDFLKKNRIELQKGTESSIETEAVSDEAQDWISKKIKYLVEHEGKTQEEAAGQAYGMARSKGFDIPEKKADQLPPQPPQESATPGQKWVLQNGQWIQVPESEQTVPMKSTASLKDEYSLFA